VGYALVSWATPYVEQLKGGRTVKFRPRGSSMKPRIESGQLVTLMPPSKAQRLGVGAIVLCKVNGKEWLHLISAVGADGRFQISNNRGRVNGWCTADSVYGVVTKVER
jgi:hypothetical protein